MVFCVIVLGRLDLIYLVLSMVTWWITFVCSLSWLNDTHSWRMSSRQQCCSPRTTLKYVSEQCCSQFKVWRRFRWWRLFRWSLTQVNKQYLLVTNSGMLKCVVNFPCIEFLFRQSLKPAIMKTNILARKPIFRALIYNLIHHMIF